MYLTVTETADKLRLCKKMIYNLIKSGEIPAIRLGPQTIRIDEFELQRYINAHKA